MGDFYSLKKSCTSEIPGADQEQEQEHELCLRYLTQLDISSSETDPDDLEFADNYSSIFHDFGKNQNGFSLNSSESDEPLSPIPNLTPLSDEISSNYKTPSGKKLTSAMKGSREKEGKNSTKLNVKWASDVYDPPVTSDDHTMKRVSYKPRIKSTKKEYYYKQQKYAKSKGSNGKSEKKRTSHSTSKSNHSSKITDPRMIRLLAKHEKSLRNNYPNSLSKNEELHGQSKIISEKKTNEIKFGGSFCRELVSSPLHRSLAEAS